MNTAFSLFRTPIVAELVGLEREGRTFKLHHQDGWTFELTAQPETAASFGHQFDRLEEVFEALQTA